MSKIERVTLYKHGLGYFEVSREVDGAAEFQLQFRSEEMNDVLKSLTVHDPGGQVQSVSYDSQKSVSELLQEIALELPKSGGAAALLGRLQGAQIVAKLGSKPVQGAVVGLETRPTVAADQVVQETWLTLWCESQMMQSFRLSELESLEVCDEALRSDLSYALEVMFKANKRDTKQVTVITRGQGKRQLRLGYLVEAPAWKSSYRILLAAHSEQPTYFEGWALVDNPRDEDWENIELTLVAGLPISFRHDLYSPRYVERQEIAVQSEALAGPVQVAGAVPQATRAMAFGAAADPFAAAPSMDMFAAADPFAAPAAFAPEGGGGFTPQQPVEVLTQSLGDMFHFRLQHPVTVKRNQSALVPIVGQPASARKVVLYNSGERETHPFAAVEFTNDTGLTLEGGPLLVIEEGSYAGEAMLDTLKPNERRIIPYAVDLAVKVESQQQHRQESVHQVKALQGELTLYSADLDSRTYVFDNNDERDKVLWLEHPLRSGWELYDTPAETERSPSHYRFRLDLAAHQVLEFRVVLKHIRQQVVSLTQLNLQQIAYYRSGGYFSREAEPVLDELMEKFRQRNALLLEIQENERRSKECQSEVERCRKHLPSLGTSEDEARLRSKYVLSMDENENEIQRLRARLQELRSLSESQWNDIVTRVRSIQFEKNL